MKTSLTRLFYHLFMLAALATQASAQTTAFTYQGRLTDGPEPAAGLYDFEFKLHADDGGAAQVGHTMSLEDVNVTGGLFIVTLDFGAAVFDGGTRWLEIAVRPGASTGAYTGLTPRQPLTSTPYAIKAAVASAVPSGSVTGNMLADGAVTAAKLAPGAVSHMDGPAGVPSAALQVSNKGLVGVGTTAPAAGLHITASQSFLNPEPLAVLVDESGGYTALSGAKAIAVQDNLAAIVSLYDSGITLVDVSNPAAPVLRSQFRDEEGVFTQLAWAQSVAMKPGLLAVGSPNDSAVTLIDVSNPNSPVKLAELRDGIDGWNELSGVSGVAIEGNLMVIAALSDQAVTLVDITNPASPVKLSELKDGTSGFDYLLGATHVALTGNLLAIGATYDSAVTLVDVAHPANPVKRAELRDGLDGFNCLDGIGDVKISGNLLAISSSFSSAVTLVDVENPANPVKLSEIRDGEAADKLGGAAGLAFSGSHLAVAASGDNAVTILDVSDSVNPGVVAVARNHVNGFNHLHAPHGLAFAGPNLLVAAFLSRAVTSLQMTPRAASLSSQSWVGIGTTLPAGALHVVGDVFVEQSNYINLNTAQFSAGIETIASAFGSTALGQESIASGYASTAMGHASVASGYASTAMGQASVASGYASTAMGQASVASGGHSTVMGWRTSASGEYSTAMGIDTKAPGRSATAMGEATIASGELSTAMGERSTASGFASTALGSNARALHDGSFVWSDRQAGHFESTAANQFNVRALGGLRLSNQTNLNFGNQTRQMINLNDGAYGIGVQSSAAYFRTDGEFFWYRGGVHSDEFAEPGEDGTQLMRLGTTGDLIIAGTLSQPSDRNIKQGFANVNLREVLEKVVALPIQTWTYKSNTASRHLGPVAQDFQAAFGLNGDDDKHIATVDADGVALAAIKGLNEKVEQRGGKADSRIRKLEAENAEMKARLKRLEQLLTPPAAD